MVTSQDLENNNRFKLGKQHGADDRESGLDTDIRWFKRTGFYEKDGPYCAGYEIGYLEGKKGKKK